ncbi:MAG: Uma2 family endonuclease [Spirochaetia bacterium]|nr:Uma2 family endonuclease [Spirochaetia bacterium]
MVALPIRIPDLPSMDNDRLYTFCVYNPELKIERNHKGELLIMAPTGGETGNRNFYINGTIFTYLKQNKTQGKFFDSSTGFLLPNKAIRSPDASWISHERWNALRPEERKKFVPLAPDFVIELLSESDELSFAKIKMEEWMENGVRLAWLLDPFDKTSYIYRQNQKVEIISGIVTLKGEDVLPDFRLDLSEVYGEV